jgi:maleylpyruvate isomerase
VIDLDEIDRLAELLTSRLDGLTDEQVRGPSRLPGWTRGHVLAHIAGVGNAVARQIENATAGRQTVDFYDGGQAGRDAAIEAAAADPAATHVARVGTTLARLRKAFARLTTAVLDQPTGHRGRPVSALVRTWWREVGIHLTDLDLGVDHSVWDAAFRAHLADHLAGRVPRGVQLHLAAMDTGERRTLGDGELVVASGSANDLMAWLAGREPIGQVTFERAGIEVPPPELGPWP